MVERGDGRMKHLFEKVIIRYGSKLCAVALTMASMTPFVCRSQWYQPREPEELNMLSKKN